MTQTRAANDVRMIIIDDDQLVRDFAVHTIEYGTNQKVATFDSGFKAWQYIQNQPKDVDIVIADANIPDMDGMELLDRVKKAHPKKKFIIITSNPSFESRAKQLGADAFLTKPFDIKDLFDIVQRFCSGLTPPAELKIAPFPQTQVAETSSEE